MSFELPQITLDKVDVKRKDDTFTITVNFSNTGNLPVALRQAQLVKIVQEDRLQLSFDKKLTKGGTKAQLQILNPATFDKTLYLGYTQPGQKQTATFQVKLNGIKGAKGKVKLLSTRGGYAEQEITLGQPDEK